MYLGLVETMASGDGVCPGLAENRKIYCVNFLV